MFRIMAGEPGCCAADIFLSFVCSINVRAYVRSEMMDIFGKGDDFNTEK